MERRDIYHEEYDNCPPTWASPYGGKEVILHGNGEEAELIIRGLKVLMSEIAIRDTLDVKTERSSIVHMRGIQKLIDELSKPLSTDSIKAK